MASESIPGINIDAASSASNANSSGAIDQMRDVFQEALQKQMEISKLKSENNVAMDAARSAKTS
jgi:hypothetical protein